MHLEILKANPTSYEDVIDKFLTYEAFEIQVGVKTSRPSGASTPKEKHAISDRSLEPKDKPEFADRLMDPITSTIMKLERMIIGCNHRSSPNNNRVGEDKAKDTKTVYFSQKESHAPKPTPPPFTRFEKQLYDPTLWCDHHNFLGHDKAHCFIYRCLLAQQ